MIAEEIRKFLVASGLPAIRLSEMSGVPCSTISNLLRGKRKHVIGPNQDALRAAMCRLLAECEAAKAKESTDA